ncbi:MAG: hypothetical protein H0Z28_04405 [Archaeoglobus sp.]|nr:hypothetical protein [Archaeoglobus sp.]
MAEAILVGAELCEYRAKLSESNPAEWDCLDCVSHGFEPCEIECSVPCSECIARRLCSKKGVEACLVG